MVLGIELEVEPGAAIGDDTRSKEILARRMRLALVMVEEDARAAMHLRDDDALGAVDDEGAILGHERHVAHVDVLLLDVADRARAGILVDVPDDEAEGHLQRRGEGNAALLAFLDVIFRRLELVAHEFELRALREVADREHRLKDLLQADAGARLGRHAHLQEMVVGALLHFDQVGHRRDLWNAPEVLAEPSATRERTSHGQSSSVTLCAPTKIRGQRHPSINKPIRDRSAERRDKCQAPAYASISRPGAVATGRGR